MWQTDNLLISETSSGRTDPCPRFGLSIGNISRRRLVGPERPMKLDLFLILTGSKPFPWNRWDPWDWLSDPDSQCRDDDSGQGAILGSGVSSPALGHALHPVSPRSEAASTPFSGIEERPP